MIQIISTILVLFSFLTMSAIFWSKVPLLAEVDLKESQTKRRRFCVKEKILSLSFFKNFSWSAILLKALSKIRVAVLKIEKKISEYLELLRKRYKNRK